MTWRFIGVGKPSLPFARDGLAEYLRRLGRYARAEFLPVRAGGGAEAETGRLLKASEGAYRIALDERGENWGSVKLAGRVADLEMDGSVKAVAVLIGGADGHGAALRDAADLVLSFGRLTMQHELALVVAAEQIYRVYTIRRGEPYHRG